MGFSGALGWAFKQLFQTLPDSRFLAMTQIMQKLLHPLFGLVGAFPVQSVTPGPEVLAGMVKIQSLDRAGKAVLRQIPEPDRPIHDHTHVTGATQSSAACLGLHRRSKVNPTSLTNGPNGIMPRRLTLRPSFRLTSSVRSYAPKPFDGGWPKPRP